MAVLFRENAVVNLHRTRGRLLVSILSHTVGCGAANGYIVEIWGRICARTVRRATNMAIRDALHLYDLEVSWLITRGAADDWHHHHSDVTATGPDCTRFPREVIRQRRWLCCCAGSSWMTEAETYRLSEMREAAASGFRWSRRVGVTSTVVYDKFSGCHRSVVLDCPLGREIRRLAQFGLQCCGWQVSRGRYLQYL